MVLLHLLRQEVPELPVIFFREPWQPGRYAFQDWLIRSWGLQVISWHPTMTAFQRNENELELQNVYRINEASFSCPTGITHRGPGPCPREGEQPWACAVEMARRPTQERLNTHAPFQAFWVGHKACDTDAVLGGLAGTGVDAAMRPDGALALFPLRDWSHADVWQYIQQHDVPYDRERYGDTHPATGHPMEWADKRHNADYVNACTACINSKPDAPRFVYCPKLEADVVNCPEAVPWTTPARTGYMLSEAPELAS